MTTTAFVPTIISRMFVAYIRENLIYESLVNRNYESEIRSTNAGTISIPIPGSTVSIRTYSENTAIASAETSSGSVVNMALNKYRYAHIYNDFLQIQERPDTWRDQLITAAYEMSKAWSEIIRVEQNTAYDTTRRIAAQSQHPDHDDFGENFLENVAKFKERLTRDNLMVLGRPWLIVPAQVIRALELYFTQNAAAGVYLPQTSEQSLRRGFSGSLFGVDLITSNTITDGTALATKPTWRLYGSVGDSAQTYAISATSSSFFEPENKFGMAYKILTIGNSKVIRPTLLYSIELQKAA